jgi:hypothetical protein
MGKICVWDVVVAEDDAERRFSRQVRRTRQMCLTDEEMLCYNLHKVHGQMRSVVDRIRTLFSYSSRVSEQPVKRYEGT